MLIAQLAILLQALGDDAVEFRRNVRIQSPRRGGPAIENGVKNQSRAVALERRGARRHLVQHRAEREQIGAGIDRLGPHLFGRHVRHRPQDTPGTGQLRRPGDGCRRFPTAGGRPDGRQAEVQNLGVAPARDEEIRRLEIAVHDPRGVRGFKGVGHLDGERQQLIDVERAPGDALLQRHPLEELHHEERASTLLADIVDGADAGVIERRCRACLALESSQGVGILRELRRQELHGDEALQPRILRLVDHAHPPGAQLLDDAVVRERLTDQGTVPGPDMLDAVVEATPAFSKRACGDTNRRSGEKLVGAVVGRKQRPYLLLQLLVAAAGALQEHVPLRDRRIERRLQQLIDVVPAFVVHPRSGQPARDTTRPWRSSTRASP